MNPAVRSVQGNVITLRERRPELVRRSEVDAEVQRILVAAIRSQERPEPQPDQYAGAWRLVLDLAAVAVLIAGVAVLMARLPG